MKTEGDLAIYNKQVVFIFDECHRSQFGEAQNNLKKNLNASISSDSPGRPSSRKMRLARTLLLAYLVMAYIPM